MAKETFFQKLYDIFLNFFVLFVPKRVGDLIILDRVFEAQQSFGLPLVEQVTAKHLFETMQ